METTIEVLLKAAEFIENNQNDPMRIQNDPKVSKNSSILIPNNKKKIVQKMDMPNRKNNMNNNPNQTLRIFTESMNELSRNTLFISKLKNIDLSNHKTNFTSKQGYNNNSEEYNNRSNNSIGNSISECSDFSSSNEASFYQKESPNEASFDSDQSAKSPLNLYSTSPSSFSCSSSNSSLYSNSFHSNQYMNSNNNNQGSQNGQYLGHDLKICEDDDDIDDGPIDYDNIDQLDSDKYKPEDIKRNKMIHNILEKNRRAHLKDCFENLQNELPHYRDKKVTNLLILKQTIKYMEHTKRAEHEYENEFKRLLNCKADLIHKLQRLQNEQIISN